MYLCIFYVCIYIYIYIMYVCMYICMYVCIYVCMCIPYYELVHNNPYIAGHNNVIWVYLLLVWNWSYTNTVLPSVFCTWNWRSFVYALALNANGAWPTVRLTVPITAIVWFDAFNKLLIQHSLTHCFPNKQQSVHS